jgi:hypothetical protein
VNCRAPRLRCGSRTSRTAARSARINFRQGSVPAVRPPPGYPSSLGAVRMILLFAGSASPGGGTDSRRGRSGRVGLSFSQRAPYARASFLACVVIAPPPPRPEDSVGKSTYRAKGRREQKRGHRGLNAAESATSRKSCVTCAVEVYFTSPAGTRIRSPMTDIWCGPPDGVRAQVISLSPSESQSTPGSQGPARQPRLPWRRRRALGKSW